MIDSEQKQQDSTSNWPLFATPAGAIVSIVCFFLPWIDLDCATASGFRLANNLDQHLLWPVLFAAIFILGILVFMTLMGTTRKAAPYIVAASVVALALLVIEFLGALDDLSQYDVSAGDLFLHCVSGFSVQPWALS